MPQIIPIKIAGIFAYPEAKEPLKHVPLGGKILFEREPLNPHDPNAIALYIEAPSTSGTIGDTSIQTADIRRFKIGYVPKERAAYLRDRKILGITRGTEWNMVVIEVA